MSTTPRTPEHMDARLEDAKRRALAVIVRHTSGAATDAERDAAVSAWNTEVRDAERRAAYRETDAYERYRAIGYTDGEIMAAPECQWCDHGRLFGGYSRRIGMCEDCRATRARERRGE